ncbi:MAG: cell division protein FtsL [Burkholderia sp.]|nr:cell division protein FtsL [Burkholderia sp.]
MSYLDIFLSVILIGCALFVVKSTDQQRQFFIKLQNEQSKEIQLCHERLLLQYQKSVLLKPYRIDKLARKLLKMQPISIERTQYITQTSYTDKDSDMSISSDIKAHTHK